MPKKKKNPSPTQVQKLAAAQYKKEFFRKFNFFFNIFCDEKLYKLIPPSIFEKIYNIRSHSLRPIAAKGSHITNTIIGTIKEDLTDLLKNESIVIEGKNIEISLYDFLTVGLSLIKFCYVIGNGEFPGAEKIKEGIKQFDIGGEFDLKIREKIHRILQAAVYWCNEFGKCLYWLKYEVEGFADPSGGISHLAYVHSYIPQHYTLKIDGIARPVILFEWASPQTGPECITIKPSVFNINSPFAEIPMKVYIQNHALHRLTERIDSIDPCVVYFFMYISFDDPKVFYDNHNNILIEYRLAGIRAGYFHVDIIDGNIVVRTFLFITNNGTPEGQLLEKNTGLQKQDKKYLAIDKLSTFMTSDIIDNKFLNKIFNESGCHSLIELFKKMENLYKKETNHSSLKFLVDYLNYSSTDFS